MRASLFKLGDRPYVNNAVVINNILVIADAAFLWIKDFEIKFNKPLTTQADVFLSTGPIEGHCTGSFMSDEGKVFFAYIPAEEELHTNQVHTNLFHLLARINDANRDLVVARYEEEHGKITTEKVIFVKGMIVDYAVLRDARLDCQIDILTSHTGNGRYKNQVHLDGVFLGYRYTTVKDWSPV